MTTRQQLREALGSRRPGERPAAWLARVAEALPSDRDADDDLLAELVNRVNGSLGDEQRQIEQDPDAHVGFWRTLAERYPGHPLARAAYADTLLLTGDTPGARREMLAAIEADPKLLYRMSGEYRGLMEEAGGRDWAAYRGLAIRAAELDDPELNRDYIAEELKELMDDVGHDPELRQVALRSLQAGAGR
jgi:hypothetical protein